MPSQIDPYTGRLIIEPYRVSPGGGGGGGLLGVLSDLAMQRRDQVVKERATEVVERYRESALQQPSQFLEARKQQSAQEAQDYREAGPLDAAISGVTAPFRALAPSNVGEYLAGDQPVQSGRPMESSDDAIASLNEILQPGTAEYKDYADQIHDIKQRAILNKLSPIFEERYGISTQDLNPASLEYILKTENQFGPDTQIRERTVPGPDGIERKQVFLEDQRTGSMIPLTGQARKRPRQPRAQTGTLVITDKEGNTTVVTGDQAIVEKVRAGERGKKLTALETKRTSLKVLAQDLDRVEDHIQTGQEPTGPLARASTKFKAAAVEATRGLKVVGFDNLAEFLEKYDNPAIAETVRKNAKLRVGMLSMAATYARALDPEGRDISAREMDRAIEALAPIYSGDPTASGAAVRELINKTVNNFNVEAQSLGEPEFNVQDIAPGLYEPRGGAKVVPGRDVQRGRQMGIGLTAAQRRELMELGKKEGAQAVRDAYKRMIEQRRGAQ